MDSALGTEQTSGPPGPDQYVTGYTNGHFAWLPEIGLFVSLHEMLLYATGLYKCYIVSRKLGGRYIPRSPVSGHDTTRASRNTRFYSPD